MKEGINQTDEITAELGAQISTLHQALAQRGRAIIQMDGEIRSLKQAAVRQQREQEQQKQFIVNAFTNSLSWKLSSPIRWTGAACRKTKLFFSQILGKTRGEPRVPMSTVDEPIVVEDGATSSQLPKGRLPASLVPVPNSRAEIVERAVQEILDRGRAPGSAMDGYVHRVTGRVEAGKLDVKAIAFYMPQFYPILHESQDRELESRRGDGLDEWSKVAAAAPRYLGHYQPHLPGDLGFYDLRLPDVMRQQIELARQYGIYGFCFQHYWSGGEDRFGLPLRQLLADPGMDIPFCLCWANGIWRWDPSANGIDEMSRDASQEELAVIDSIQTALSDPRYIRIDGKPLLIVFGANLLHDAAATAQRWRKQVAEMGSPGLYLVAARSFDLRDPRVIGFDAIVEYPPYETDLTDLGSKVSLIDTKFSGCIRSYPEMVERQIRLPEPPFVNFKTVMTGWDDEARIPGAGHSFAGATPALYGKWLKHSCEIARSRPPGHRFVFINAWNDWANGAHLEPDRRFGYAQLHVTANVLRQYHNDPDTRQFIQATNAAFRQTSDVAIILHCHYEDLIGPVFDHYLSRMEGADLFVTTRHDFSRDAIEEIRRYCPNVFIQCEENRGRDIRPFLFALRRIQALPYKFACKIHTKKAPHLGLELGELWRQSLMEPLLGADGGIARVAQIFSEEPDLGLLAPKGSVMDLRQITTNMLNTIWLDRLLTRMNREDLIENYAFHFPAGSMFWFRVAALAGLDDFVLAEDEFEQECGQTDGTLAHAVERLVVLFAEQRGYRMREIS